MKELTEQRTQIFRVAIILNTHHGNLKLSRNEAAFWVHVKMYSGSRFSLYCGKWILTEYLEIIIRNNVSSSEWKTK